MCMNEPLLRQRILTWLPVSEAVRASNVGEKNIASSSGWAMSRQMRLLRRVGREVRMTCAVYSHAVVKIIGMARAK